MRKKFLIGLTPLLVSAAFAVAPAMAQATPTITSARQALKAAEADGSAVPGPVAAGSESKVQAGSEIKVKPLWSHLQADETALVYAAETWHNGPRLFGCVESGVDLPGYVQWECFGYFEGGPNEWYVGIGPYGTVLEAYKYS
ncbi:MAG TPA: hypothetical protein VK778_06835 [Solirubrobacteraceae bacterium]|jgi:hypothetical protein|nr:hypothetical protein [Solirubrobacteraceae bacterium]